MRRLNELACQQDDCDVLAHTGDCLSDFSHQVPIEWDEWPQKVKLSIPGNHGDHSETFESHHNWIHKAPWHYLLADVLFIGFDLERKRWPGYLEERKNLCDGAKAIVLLSHWRPLVQREPRFAQALAEFIGGREMLILHGHEHPKDFSGSDWDSEASFCGRRFYRSHVCSSVSACRGVGHRITWNDQSFEYSKVRGESDGTTIK